MNDGSLSDVFNRFNILGFCFRQMVLMHLHEFSVDVYISAVVVEISLEALGLRQRGLCADVKKLFVYYLIL